MDEWSIEKQMSIPFQVDLVKMKKQFYKEKELITNKKNNNSLFKNKNEGYSSINRISNNQDTISLP